MVLSGSLKHCIGKTFYVIQVVVGGYRGTQGMFSLLEVSLSLQLTVKALAEVAEWVMGEIVAINIEIKTIKLIKVQPFTYW